MTKSNSLYILDIDKMNAYNWKYSRLQGDILLSKIETEINSPSNKEVIETTRYSDEFYIVTKLNNLSDCIAFGNMLLKKVAKLKITATAVFTFFSVEEDYKNSINKLKIGLLKTKSQMNNIIGYIE